MDKLLGGNASNGNGYCHSKNESPGGYEPGHSLLRHEPVRADQAGEEYVSQCKQDATCGEAGAGKRRRFYRRQPRGSPKDFGRTLQKKDRRESKRQREGSRRQRRSRAQGSGRPKKEGLSAYVPPIGGGEEAVKAGVPVERSEADAQQARLGGAGGVWDDPTSFECGGKVGGVAVMASLLNSVQTFSDLGAVLNWCLQFCLRCKSQSFASVESSRDRLGNAEADASFDTTPRAQWDSVTFLALQSLAGQGEDTGALQTLIVVSAPEKKCGGAAAEISNVG